MPSEPTTFTEIELRFLRSPIRALGRIATVDREGAPHVVPTGWTYNEQLGTLDVTGRDVDHTKKYRDVTRTRRAAIVIDGIAPGAGFHPWAIEIGGRAEAVSGPPALIRVHPERVRSWGLEAVTGATGEPPGEH